MVLPFVTGQLVGLAARWAHINLWPRPGPIGNSDVAAGMKRGEFALVVAMVVPDLPATRVDGAFVLLLSSAGALGWVWTTFDPNDELRRLVSVGETVPRLCGTTG